MVFNIFDIVKQWAIVVVSDQRTDWVIWSIKDQESCQGSWAIVVGHRILFKRSEQTLYFLFKSCCNSFSQVCGIWFLIVNFHNIEGRKSSQYTWKLVNGWFNKVTTFFQGELKGIFLVVTELNLIMAMKTESKIDLFKCFDPSSNIWITGKGVHHSLRYFGKREDMDRFVLRRLSIRKIFKHFLEWFWRNKIHSLYFAISLSLQFKSLHNGDAIIDKFHHFNSIAQHFQAVVVNNEDEINSITDNAYGVKGYLKSFLAFLSKWVHR